MIDFPISSVRRRARDSAALSRAALSPQKSAIHHFSRARIAHLWPAMSDMPVGLPAVALIAQVPLYRTTVRRRRRAVKAHNR